MGRKKSSIRGKKEIKVIAKKNFKKSSSSLVNKPMGRLDEELAKDVKDKLKKDKKAEENMILDCMKRIQLEQWDTGQACSGWSDALHGVHIHVEHEAVQFV